MLLKTLFIQPVKIQIGYTTHVNIKDNIQFSITVHPTNKEFHVYQIENIVGDFEIVKISSCEDNKVLPYDNINKTFASNYHFDAYDFHILANVEFDVVNDSDDTYEAKVKENPHHLRIPLESLTPLTPNQCFEKEIIFPEFHDLKCTCYIKKIDYETIEIHIENPQKIGINGQPTDFRSHLPATDPILLELSFDPTIAINLE
uniref:Uncharacterized protein n=1 Tax=Panagrolaimus sp. PS1159 TaxID=55785 RepID=A0AC35EYU5_9BILA